MDKYNDYYIKLINHILHEFIIGKPNIIFPQNEPYISIIKNVLDWLGHHGCQIITELEDMEYTLDLTRIKSIDMSDQLYTYIINKLLFNVFKKEFMKHIYSSYSPIFSWAKYKIKSDTVINIFFQWINKYFEIDTYENAIKIINIDNNMIDIINHIRTDKTKTRISLKIHDNDWIIYIDDPYKAHSYNSLKKTLISYAYGYIRKIIWYIMLGHTNYYCASFIEYIITKNIFEPYGIIFNKMNDECNITFKYEPHINTEFDTIILENTNIVVSSISTKAYEISHKYNSFEFNIDYGINSDYLINKIINHLNENFNIKSVYNFVKYTRAVNIVFESMINNNYIISDSLIFG